MKTKAMMTCVRLRNASSSGRRNRSTHTLVVNAVSAESAEEKQAATMPMEKRTVTTGPKRPPAVKSSISSSVFSGKAMPHL